MKVSEDLQVCV